MVVCESICNDFTFSQQIHLPTSSKYKISTIYISGTGSLLLALNKALTTICISDAVYKTSMMQCLLYTAIIHRLRACIPYV